PVVVRLEPVEELLRRAVEIKLPQAILAGTPTWGLTDTGAPAFWSTYGRQGQGIIVANIDTGVQYDHPALVNSFRCQGSVLPTAACWKDVTPTAATTPYDDQGHGTHTMGTMVGSNNPALTNNVGMAPGAKWIACKAFVGTSASNQDLLECAQWLLAPGGSAANRPHIINNSWGGDPSSYDEWFLPSVQAWRAAGIFPVFSAGNDGVADTCKEIGSPANYPEAFTVAAHDSNGWIAYFSSQGPSGTSLKPNLSAPGVNIYSSVPGNAYGYLSGTSMSAPHASGAAALLWSCNPALIGQIDQTFTLLENSAGAAPAGNCSAPASGGGNYTYGYGYLNAFQAGQGVCIGWYQTFLPLISNNYNYVPPDPTQNGGFESGHVAWVEDSTNNFDLIMNASGSLPVPPHNGSWAVWLGGYLEEVSSISQSVTIPAGRSILHYWFYSESVDSCNFDFFKIFVGGTLRFSETLCVSNETNAWVHRTVDLSAYAGTTQAILFRAETDSINNSNVFLDDISFETSTALSSSAVNGSSDPLPVGGSASERLKTRKQD
ncbi:MAG: S8 family serine peptidase, partial [Bellilinea sp.]